MLKKTLRVQQHILHASLFGCALSGLAPAFAIQIETGNPDLNLFWDNSVCVNIGVRTDKQDQRILNSKHAACRQANSY
jgi:hypothetical protein